jgi:hypothetical protein
MNLDIAQYFADTAALAVLVVAVTAFIREHVLTTVKGWAVIALSLVIGAAAGAGGHFLGYIDTGFGGALAFGVSAGFLASGGFDAVKSLLGGKSSGD